MTAAVLTCGGDGRRLLGVRGLACPDIEQPVRQRLLSLPSRFELDAPRLRRRELSSHPATIGGVHADSLFAADDPELDVQRLDRAPAVLELRRDGVLADRHARADGVEQARLCPATDAGNVRMRQADSRFERLVEQHHPMMLLEHRRHTARTICVAFSSLGSATWTTWKRG